MKVHVHIYNAKDEVGDMPLVAELDLEQLDEYPDPDGYKQFGFIHPVTKEWIEIRLMNQ